MRKVILIATLAIITSCSSTKETTKKSLYEVLIVNNDGGANIKFYEILTEPKEIKMLLGDEAMRKKITSNDITMSNFVILNSGPTEENMNKITIEKVNETPTQIEIYIQDSQKNIERSLSNDDSFFPYTIIKINSKKPIVIK